MKRISNCFAVPVLALLSSLHLSGSSEEASRPRSPEQMLGSDLHFCASKSASIVFCKERLQTALMSYSDKRHAPLNRHVESFAERLSNALSRQGLNPDTELRLATAILQVLHGADLPVSAVSKNLTNAKAALADTNIPDADRSSVIGSLVVLSQDVRGPEDEGAQIAPRLPPNLPKREDYSADW